MFKNPGTKWPIIIGLSIVGVIGACVWTIKVALNNPGELSNYGMQGYHDYDANANEIINAKIAFDQNYTIAFLTPQISEKGSILEYKVSDKSGNAVNDAKVEIILTRPDIKEFDMNLSNPSVAEGKRVDGTSWQKSLSEPCNGTITSKRIPATRSFLSFNLHNRIFSPLGEIHYNSLYLKLPIYSRISKWAVGRKSRKNSV